MAHTTFGERVKARREQKRLTQTQLAILVGIAQSTVHDWENDKRSEQKAPILFRLAAALDVNVTWLYTGEGLPYGAFARDEHEVELLEMFRRSRQPHGGHSDPPEAPSPYLGAPASIDI